MSDVDNAGPLLGFVCHEYLGFEVYLLPKMPGLLSLPVDQLLDSRKWPRTSDGKGYLYHNKLTRREDLHDRDTVIIKANPFDYRWDLGKVVAKGEHGKWYAVCGSNICPLNFAEDDRQCWTSGGVFNIKAIQKATFTL